MSSENFIRKPIVIKGHKFLLLECEGEVWWPLTSVFRVYMSRSSEIAEKEYNNHIKFFEINHTERQPKKRTKYIKEMALICSLIKSDFKRLRVDQIEKQNELHRYLGMLEVSTTISNKKNKIKTKIKTIRWSKEKVVEEIIKRHMSGKDLSKRIVYDENRLLHNAGLRLYGSWGNAIQEAGLNYEDYIEDVDKTKYYGIKFEQLLANILSELNYEYVKGYNNFIKPDFRINGNKLWIDAKLSQWTGSIQETIEKYESYCDKLMIVFLRGNKKCDRKIADKTQLVSVYKMINEFPSDRYKYYTALLNQMQSDVNKCERDIG